MKAIFETGTKARILGCQTPAAFAFNFSLISFCRTGHSKILAVQKSRLCGRPQLAASTILCDFGLPKTKFAVLRVNEIIPQSYILLRTAKMHTTSQAR